MAIRKGNTRKSVDQILDEAADILETSGWVTSQCYDSETGGYCALGAIAQSVYPKAFGYELEDLAYVMENADEYMTVNQREVDPRHAEAVTFLAQQIKRSKSLNRPADNIVYVYNDTAGGPQRRSAKPVLAKFREAAEAYRAKQAA